MHPPGEDQTLLELQRRNRELQERIDRFVHTEQELVRARDRLDGDVRQLRIMQDFSRRAYNCEDPESFYQLSMEALVAVMEVEFAFLLYREQRTETGFLLRGACGIQLVRPRVNLPADWVDACLSGPEATSRIANLPDSLQALCPSEIGEVLVAPITHPGPETRGVIVAGNSIAKQPLYGDLPAGMLVTLDVFSSQMVAIKALLLETAERRRAEAQARKNEIRYRSLFDHAPIPLWDVDFSRTVEFIRRRIQEPGKVETFLRDHPRFVDLLMRSLRIVDVNRAAVKLSEADHKQHLLDNLLRTFSDETPRSFRRLLLGLLRNEFAPLVSRHRSLRGRELTVTIYPTLLEKGVDRGGCRCLLAMVDRTAETEEREARLTLEQQLQQAQKMEALGLLAGGVAHDLNNMLGPLVSYPDLMLDEVPANSPLREHLEQMQEAATRVGASVQDLLVMARRGNAEQEPTELNHIVSQYLASREQDTFMKRHPGVTLSCHLSAAPLPLQGSPLHLRKMLMNLVLNALEAMPKGGQLTVSTGTRRLEHPLPGYDEVRQGEYAVLSVSDSGVGIEEQDQTRIFEPFYTRKVLGQSGTGLGLALAWGTTRDHGGYIDIHSRVEEGTTFEVYLPLDRRSSPRPPRTRRSDAKGPAGEGQFILVVDDMANQRKLATRILERAGYSVESVDSGEAALEFVRRQPVDLLVLDMIMGPGMDGLDTLLAVNRSKPGLRAVVVSGFAETDRVQKLLERDLGSFLGKPYRPNRLLEAVRNELQVGQAG